MNGGKRFWEARVDRIRKQMAMIELDGDELRWQVVHDGVCEEVGCDAKRCKTLWKMRYGSIFQLLRAYTKTKGEEGLGQEKEANFCERVMGRPLYREML